MTEREALSHLRQTGYQVAIRGKDTLSLSDAIEQLNGNGRRVTIDFWFGLARVWADGDQREADETMPLWTVYKVI